MNSIALVVLVEIFKLCESARELGKEISTPLDGNCQMVDLYRSSHFGRPTPFDSTRQEGSRSNVEECRFRSRGGRG